MACDHYAQCKRGDRVHMAHESVRQLRVPALALPVLLLLGAARAHADDPVAALGRQRAVDSRLESGDPRREPSGPRPHPLRAHAHRVRDAGREIQCLFERLRLLREGRAPDRDRAHEPERARRSRRPAPATLPRLVCIRPAGKGGARTAQQILATGWHVNKLGDAMARGLRPSTLRACSAIGILQDVALPKGWDRASAAVRFEITPYDRELDAIFATCGEASAYAAAGEVAAEPSPAAVPAAPPAPVRPASPAPAAAAPWKTARTVARGRSNVRAAPNIHAPIVAQLNPGTVVLIQSTGGQWWRVKPRSGARFEGYIREDRLVVK